jgi:hypothetical protein
MVASLKEAGSEVVDESSDFCRENGLCRVAYGTIFSQSQWDGLSPVQQHGLVQQDVWELIAVAVEEISAVKERKG